MSSLWDAVFTQVPKSTGPLMLNMSVTPYTYKNVACRMVAPRFTNATEDEIIIVFPMSVLPN
jgi:hypothetical protein